METIPAIRQLRGTTRPIARCKAGTGKPPKERTAGCGGNGFLNHHFQPFLGFEFGDWKKAEAEFFTSANNLCQLYGIEKPDVSGFSFPQNIATMYLQLTDSFGSDKDCTCLIMQDDTHSATIATVKTFDTGYRLYYIPVRPLWRLLTNEPDNPLNQVMLAIYGYFYKEIKVGYYREPGYLNQTYETIENWIEEDNDGEDEDYRLIQRKELDTMNTAGDKILPLIKDGFSLKNFSLAIEVYLTTPNYDSVAVELAQEIYKLATDYPKHKIPIPENLSESEENERIYFEQYVSFYWSCQDCFFDMLNDMVNNEFQEMGSQEEPISVQWFDMPQEKELHSFDFETRLFNLINEFIDLLNDYDEEH